MKLNGIYSLIEWEIYWIWQIDGVICEINLIDNHAHSYSI